MAGNIFGYARVSTRDQNEDRQLIALDKAKVPAKNIYVDKVSGKDFDRTQYRKMLKRLKKDDLLFIKSIDRLGRNYGEILEQWRIITKEKGADDNGGSGNSSDAGNGSTSSTGNGSNTGNGNAGGSNVSGNGSSNGGNQSASTDGKGTVNTYTTDKSGTDGKTSNSVKTSDTSRVWGWAGTALAGLVAAGAAVSTRRKKREQ